ncbi:hypothetical protein AVEN_189056-1 [Araneus ventricosus]|uniref:Uncharacterized protein n=1 Tax=Araneus ventricosus TaxID=182803 RepID=A0A4Y2JIV5_ARAVE|nr:hypothetical protein AVEN_189056-1 [Araneus ventricosus]
MLHLLVLGIGGEMVFASDHRTPRENKLFCNPISCGEGLPFPISEALLGNIRDGGRFRNGRHCLSGLSLVDLRKGELLSAAGVSKNPFFCYFRCLSHFGIQVIENPFGTKCKYKLHPFKTSNLSHHGRESERKVKYFTFPSSRCSCCIFLFWKFKEKCSVFVSGHLNPERKAENKAF